MEILNRIIKKLSFENDIPKDGYLIPKTLHYELRNNRDLFTYFQTRREITGNATFHSRDESYLIKHLNSLKPIKLKFFDGSRTLVIKNAFITAVNEDFSIGEFTFYFVAEDLLLERNEETEWMS